MKTLLLLLISSISLAQNYVKTSINSYGCVYVYNMNTILLKSDYNTKPPYQVNIPYQINNYSTILSILREHLGKKEFIKTSFQGLGFTFYLNKQGEILEIVFYGDNKLFFDNITYQDLYKIEKDMKQQLYFGKISKYLINSDPIKYHFTISFKKIRQ